MQSCLKPHRAKICIKPTLTLQRGCARSQPLCKTLASCTLCILLQMQMKHTKQLSQMRWKTGPAGLL